VASRLSKVNDIQTVNAAERQSRQALLTRSDRPLILHALIDENALRRRADDGPEMAYLERIAGGETVDNADDVAVLSAVWDDVAASAPSPSASAAIIRRVKEEITEHG